MNKSSALQLVKENMIGRQKKQLLDFFKVKSTYTTVFIMLLLIKV